MTTKICVQCGAEYLATAQQCADCGGRLETMGLGGSGQNDTALAAAEWLLIYTGPHDRADRLQRALAGRDVACRLEERHDLAWQGFHAMDAEDERAGVFELWVATGDAVLAAEVRQHLDLPAEDTPELQEFVEGSCPACGFALPDELPDECPDCGLALGGPEDPALDADDQTEPPAAGWLGHHPH